MKHDIAADAWAVHCVAHDIYVLAESGKRAAAKRLYEKYEGAFIGLELGMREVPVIKRGKR